MASNIQDVQDKILEIAIYLDEFCEKNSIEYYLMGGSALGAVRHQGFIPWDDDLDVFMTYDNYMKFIEFAEKELDTTRFYLQKEDTEEWPLFFTKLRMNNTTFIEEDTKHRNMHKGIYVDIMCLNNTSENFLIRYSQFIAAKLLIAQSLKKRGYSTNNIFKKSIMIIADCIVKGLFKEKLLNFVRRLNAKKTKQVGHFFGRASFKNTTFPTIYLGKPKYIKFSSAYLPVVEQVDNYLEVRYGKNYMEMPDEKTKSKYPVHAIFSDTLNDYKKYENKYTEDKNDE